MPSRFKRAHRTHALDQPAGEGYAQAASDQAPRQGGADDRVATLYAELCARVPDAAKRSELLAVAPELEAAWQEGDRLPLLRAHRKALERAIRSTDPR
jgi:hypothetical protein